MIRPFGLLDSLRLQRLAGQAVPLQLEHYLSSGQSPLLTALGAPLPWHGTGAATYLHSPDSNSPSENGFIQAIKRPNRAAADITCIAPGIDNSPHAAQIWRKLLEYVVGDAGEQGIQRLYLCLESEHKALPVIHQTGFAPYIQETLFRLTAAPPSLSPDRGATHVRPQQEADSIALQRLNSHYTPLLVQQAEGTLVKNGDAHSPWALRTWWQPEQLDGYVYEEKGDILAALQIRRGRKGHWMSLMAAADATAAITALLSVSLNNMTPLGKRSIYCPIRPYQSSFGPLLTDFGFKPGPALTRLVKHTTSPVRQTAPAGLKDLAESALPGLIPTEYNLDPKNRDRLNPS